MFVPNWFTSCEVFPELPSIQGWVEAMTSLGRLIFFDQPGTGASDPVTPGALPTLEQWADSITAVLDDLGSQRSGPPRDRRRVPGSGAVRSDISVPHHRAGRARGLRGSDAERTDGLDLEEFLAAMVADVGHGRVRNMCSIRTCRGTRRSGQHGHGMNAWRQAQGPSPSCCRSWPRWTCGRCFRPSACQLSSSTTPTTHSSRPRWAGTSPITYRARNMLSCRGATCYHFVEPWRESFQEIAEFLTGHQAEVADDRVLATVLFTDIVDSTRRAAEMGDRDWHALLDAHDAVVRAQLARFRGREVNTSGDGFLAMFDGPQRAIRCAMAIRDAVQALGIEVRAGLHTGECEVRGDDIGGIAVHIGARVSALAGPNDVLVSSTLRDLVIGSGLEFEDRGAHELKGVPGDWHLFAVASA